MSPRTNHRRIKLPRPELQLRMVGSFVALSCLALLMQFLLLAAQLSQFAGTMPAGGPYLTEAMPDLLMRVAGLSFLLLLPLTFAVGVLVTFRVAGPIANFENYLERVIRGESVGPCRLRKGDDLKKLCQLINQALEVSQGESVDRTTQVPPAAATDSKLHRRAG